MKRFKVFKILYYGFMVVIGVILCFAMPGYNQYNALTKAIKEDIKTENYSDIPGFFASYYNDQAVLSSTNDNGSKFLLYEATNYEALQNSSFYYAQEVYMGFVFNVSSFDTQTYVDADGNPIKNSMRVEYSDGTNTITKSLATDNLAYIQELDFIYFYLPYKDYNESDLTGINNIKVYDGRSENNLYIEASTSSNLTFESEYFTQASTYVELFNRMYTHLNLNLDGTFTKEDTQTKLASFAKITYTPTGPTVLRLEGNPDVKVEGASLIEGSNNRYQMTNGQVVTITANSETYLTQVVVEVGSLSVNYNFGQSIVTETSKANYEQNYNLEDSVSGTKTLGQGFDSAKQESDFTKWNEETYTFSKTNYQEALNGVTTKTMLQIVAYFVVMMIIGDFLVGKRHILALCSRLFGKNRKNKKSSPENTEINNVYEVNFACTVHVPVGYTKPVKVVYQKDYNNIVTFELLKEHNYKSAQRTQNGLYKLVSAEAQGLHPIKKQVEVQVRGYRMETIINFAYDEKKTEDKNLEQSNSTLLKEDTINHKVDSEINIVEDQKVTTDFSTTDNVETNSSIDTLDNEVSNKE